jgi:hypothetical protein
MRALAVAVAIATTMLGIAACGSSKKQNVVYIQPEGGTSSGAVRTTNDGGPEDCRAEDDLTSCGECCRDEHQSESVLYGQLVLKCYCQASVCMTQCKDSLCSTSTTQATKDDPCDQCLTAQNTLCANQVNPGCLNDPKCAPILQCFADAQCDQKPEL